MSMKSRLTLEEEIIDRIEYLTSGEVIKIGAVLKSIQEDPIGHPKIAKAIEPLLESTRFYRIGIPGNFAFIRLMAGAALAAEWDLLGIDKPIIVRQAKLYLFCLPKEDYPRNEDHSVLWEKVYELNIPRTGDVSKDFVTRTLGGLQMLYERGEFPLELKDYTMHHGKNMWLSATPPR